MKDNTSFGLHVLCPRSEVQFKSSHFSSVWATQQCFKCFFFVNPKPLKTTEMWHERGRPPPPTYRGNNHQIKTTTTTTEAFHCSTPFPTVPFSEAQFLWDVWQGAPCRGHWFTAVGSIFCIFTGVPEQSSLWKEKKKKKMKKNGWFFYLMLTLSLPQQDSLLGPVSVPWPTCWTLVRACTTVTSHSWCSGRRPI